MTDLTFLQEFTRIQYALTHRFIKQGRMEPWSGSLAPIECIMAIVAKDMNVPMPNDELDKAIMMQEYIHALEEKEGILYSRNPEPSKARKEAKAIRERQENVALLQHCM